MSKEKQIEEMGKVLCGMKNGCDRCMWDKVHCNERSYAEEIYNAGYRKQSEWISVDERLPERQGYYFGFTYKGVMMIAPFFPCYADGEPEFRYDITHWMPLPEAPKMKGGAE